MFADDCTYNDLPLYGRQNASTPRLDSHPAFAYGTHNNIPEGPAYPVRTVTDDQWRYIRNLTPSKLFIEKHLMAFTAMPC